MRRRVGPRYGERMNGTTAIPSPGTPASGAASADTATPGMQDTLGRHRVETIQQCIAATIRARKQLLFGMTTSLALQSVPVPRGCDLEPDALHTVASTANLRCRIDGSRGGKLDSARRQAAKRAGTIASLNGQNDGHSKPALHPIRAHIWKPLSHPPIAPRNIQIHFDVCALDLFHTFVQLATHIPFDSLVALGDSIITATAQQPMLANKRDTAAIHRDFVTFVGNLPKCKGKTASRLAMRLIIPNVLSPMESANRLALLAHGLPDAVANFTVPDARFRQSGKPMTLDLAWPQCRVAVEYDGDHHRTDQRQQQRDAEKREHLATRGWRILVATKANLANDAARAEFALRVARELMLRGTEFTFFPVAKDLRNLAGERKTAG